MKNICLKLYIDTDKEILGFEEVDSYKEWSDTEAYTYKDEGWDVCDILKHALMYFKKQLHLNINYDNIGIELYKDRGHVKYYHLPYINNFIDGKNKACLKCREDNHTWEIIYNGKLVGQRVFYDDAYDYMEELFEQDRTYHGPDIVKIYKVMYYEHDREWLEGTFTDIKDAEMLVNQLNEKDRDTKRPKRYIKEWYMKMNKAYNPNNMYCVTVNILTMKTTARAVPKYEACDLLDLLGKVYYDGEHTLKVLECGTQSSTKKTGIVKIAKYITENNIVK